MHLKRIIRNKKRIERLHELSIDLIHIEIAQVFDKLDMNKIKHTVCIITDGFGWLPSYNFKNPQSQILAKELTHFLDSFRSEISQKKFCDIEKEIKKFITTNKLTMKFYREGYLLKTFLYDFSII